MHMPKQKTIKRILRTKASTSEHNFHARGEARSERFLDIATQLFMEKGYRETKLSDIVAHAGGSLSTLYRAFGDKEGLVHALVERHLKSITENLILEEIDHLPIEQALYRLGDKLIDRVLTNESVLFHRIVVGEGKYFPELRDWYFETAVTQSHGIVSHYLDKQMQLGHLKLPSSADVAASQFCMILFGDIIIRVSCGNILFPDAKEARARAKAGLDLFMHGVLK